MRIDRELLLRLLKVLVQPVARFCVRHSLRLHDLVEIAKCCLVDAALEELEKRGERNATTRISLISGVHRKDVERIQRHEAPPASNVALTMKVLGYWQTSPAFVTREGAPRVLDTEGENSEFWQLVRLVSKELNPTTILSELERIGALERTPRGVRLVHSSYVPSRDVEAGFKIVGQDFQDLLSAGSENTLAEKQPPHLHARTEYDNILPGALPEIERWLLKEGHAFHQRAREFLSQFDQDVNPNPDFKGKGARAVVTAFSFVEPPGEYGKKK